MKTNEKISALIDAYIELAQNHHYNDSQIIDSLTDIFDEEELRDLGFGNFVFNYFHDGEDPQKPVASVDISRVAYDLYKQHWVDQNTTPWMRMQSIRDYHNYVQECRNEDIAPASYEDYLVDYGFQGALYACYDEFCDEEYHDAGYIKSLLGGDEERLKQYFDDLEVGCEEHEELLDVSEVLSAAERRCLTCAAQERGAFEQVLD